MDTSTGESSGSGLPIPIIAGGGAGGALLFFIVLFCVVFVFCKQRSKKKKAYSISIVQCNAEAYSTYENGW